MVTIYSKTTGKAAARGRTYGKTDTYEVNPGIYDVEVKALAIKGKDIVHSMDSVQVMGSDTLNLEHNFKSGKARIGASSASGLVDAVVKINDVESKKNVASSRTYTSETSNPKEFILNPGTYQVTLSALGDHKGEKDTFTITVKEGETVEKISKF